MNRKSIPYFNSRLNFNAATLMDTINFRQDAVAMGNTRGFTHEEFEKRIATGSYGMWGGSATTATPKVLREDVIPKPEDYVNIPFRFLTQTVVGAHSWKSTDFRKDEVLKNSLSLFDGTPVFSDHETRADNAAGVVIDPTWQGQVTLADGTVIPGGINAYASLDSKIQFALIRSILGGAIRSNSVSVQFTWQPSHTFETMYDFYEKLGTYDKDNKIITREVLEIQAYHETSMLFQGADPFAKKLDNAGNPMGVDKTAVSYSKLDPAEKEKYEQTKKFFVSSSFSKEELISLSSHNKQLENGNEPVKTPDNMKKKNLFLLAFVQAFSGSLGLSFAAPADGEFTDEQENEAISALSKHKAITPENQRHIDFANGLQFSNDKGEVSAFNPSVANGAHIVMTKEAHTALTGRVTKLESDLATAGAAAATALKSEQDFAVEAYRKATGDQFSQVIADVIQASTGDTLKAFTAQYAKQAGLKYGATCTKCNSAEFIQMRSSVETPADEETTPTPKVKATFSDADFHGGNFTRTQRHG